jgi:hypothetical protein
LPASSTTDERQRHQQRKACRDATRNEAVSLVWRATTQKISARRIALGHADGLDDALLVDFGDHDLTSFPTSRRRRTSRRPPENPPPEEPPPQDDPDEPPEPEVMIQPSDQLRLRFRGETIPALFKHVPDCGVHAIHDVQEE